MRLRQPSTVPLMPMTGRARCNAALQRIRSEAEDAVRSGAGHLVLTDQDQGEARVAMPMILATERGA